MTKLLAAQHPEVFNNKVVFRALGSIKTRPRVVKIENRGAVEELLKFTLRFVEYYPDSFLTQLGDVYTTAKIEDKVRSTFSATGFYTDQDGQICEFNEPRDPWFIQIDKIVWTVQKLNPEEGEPTQAA